MVIHTCNLGVKLPQKFFAIFITKGSSKTFSTAATMSRGQLREIELSPGVEGIELTEGAAKVHLKKDQGVFYNPVQCFNRDISIAVINEFLRERRNFIIRNKKTWEQRGTILEALAASGLRSIRYGLELDTDLVKEIVANDISKSAVESIQTNAKFNGLSDKVRPNLGDAMLYMYQSKAEGKFFDVIDLDPYGCAAKFLDPAVQALQNDGLLCVTATDMSILCGNTPETCHAKYGSASLRGKFCHEMALRILLCSIENAANRHGKFITPLISISVDFYIRVFVKVETSAKKVKKSASKIALVYCCNGCENFHFQPMGLCIEEGQKVNFKNSRGPPIGPNCDNCGSTFTMGGPVWKDPIHDQDFVSKLRQSLRTCTQLEVTDLPDFESLREKQKATEESADPLSANAANDQKIVDNNNRKNGDTPSRFKTDGNTQRGSFQTLRRMQGIVSVISEELFDVPLHFTQEKLSQVLRTDTLPMIKLRSAILNAGYRVSSSHTNRTSVKTDAPHHVVWDIMRYWVTSRNADRVGDFPVRQRILSQEIRTKVDLTERPEAIAPSMKDKTLRFQINPEKNWGPKARATASDDVEEKRKRLQGKKKRHRANRAKEIATDGDGDQGESGRLDEVSVQAGNCNEDADLSSVMSDSGVLAAAGEEDREPVAKKTKITQNTARISTSIDSKL